MPSHGCNLVLLGLIILGSISLHSYRFRQVEYRQDEINTVHAAAVLDTAGIVEWLGYEGTHPPSWRIFAANWVKSFGYEREIARFQSTLFTILALAFIFRLGNDLFSIQNGLLAVLFVGLLPYAQWHLHELRPYAPLIMISAAMQVVFLRWLRRPNWRMALSYVVLGGLGLQVHYFAGFIGVAHGIYLLIAWQWQPRLIGQFVGLGGLILLSFVWWVPAIYHGAFVIRDKGITYGSESAHESILTFVTDLNYAPLVLIPLLFLGTQQVYGNLATPANLTPRWTDWRRLFILIIPHAILLSAVLANNFVQLLTFRNLSVTLPLLGIGFGFVLEYLPRYLKWAVLTVYIGLASTTFVYYAPQVPHSEMALFINDDIAKHDKFLININVKGATAPAAIHYFRDHLNGQPDIERFFVVNELNSDRVGFKYNIDPFIYEIALDTYTPEDLEIFEHFLADTNHIYYILFQHWQLEDNIYTLRPQFDEILDRDFEVVRKMSWQVKNNDPNAGFTIIEYRRR